MEIKMKITTCGAVLATLLMVASTAGAQQKGQSAGVRQDSGCQKVTGNGTWSLIPSPNDPIGRILGPTTGSLKAVSSAYLTSINFGTVVTVTSQEVWVLGAQDQLVMSGQATFTPVPNQPFGTFYDALTLTITSGTGDYEGATGTINVSGIGYNIGTGGPGQEYFEVSYKGTVCRAR